MIASAGDADKGQDEDVNDDKTAMISSAGDADKGQDENVNDDKTAMIASAGDADKGQDEDACDDKTAMIASVGDADKGQDEKALSAASTSSLHTFLTDDDVDDLGTDDVDDLVGKLIKKARESKSKGSKRGGKEALNPVRMSDRPRGKADIDKECSCGCGGKPSDRNCPGCGSVSSKITMACWMKGQVCQLCSSKSQRKGVV